MNRLILVLFLLSSRALVAQSPVWSWVTFDTAYSPSPAAIPGPLVETTSAGQVVLSWQADAGIYFSQQVFATQRVQRLDSLGNRSLSLTLGRRVSLSRILSAPDDHVLLLGSFMDTLRLDSMVLLTNTQADTLSRNMFLLNLDASGQVEWVRNLTATYPQFEDYGVAAIDDQGILWYAFSDFLSAIVIAVDRAGQDSLIYPLTGSAPISLSDMAFDLGGSMYLAGAVGSGVLYWLGLPSTSIVPIYNKFIAKLDNTGQGRWIHTIEDITFVNPTISVDDSAHVYLSAELFDSVTVGPYHLAGPDWVFDFMLARWDSSGLLEWAIDVPEPATITGDLRLSRGRSAMSYADGCRVLGYYRGLVDWGNGVLIGGGPAVTNQGLVLLSFDKQGQLRHQLGIPAINGLFPAAMAGNASGGYVTGTATGSLQVDSTLIQAATPSSFFSFAARFIEPTLTFVSPHPEERNILLAPNPSAYGQLTVVGAAAPDSITVFDIQGKSVYQSEVVDCSARCSFDTGLPPGWYLVQFSSGLRLPWIITW